MKQGQSVPYTINFRKKTDEAALRAVFEKANAAGLLRTVAVLKAVEMFGDWLDTTRGKAWARDNKKESAK